MGGKINLKIGIEDADKVRASFFKKRGVPLMRSALDYNNKEHQERGYDELDTRDCDAICICEL